MALIKYSSVKKLGKNSFHCTLQWLKLEALHSRKKNYPASVYMFKANNRNARKKWKICSKLTAETPKPTPSNVSVVNVDHGCWFGCWVIFLVIFGTKIKGLKDQLITMSGQQSFKLNNKDTRARSADVVWKSLLLTLRILLTG